MTNFGLSLNPNFLVGHTYEIAKEIGMFAFNVGKIFKGSLMKVTVVNQMEMSSLQQLAWQKWLFKSSSYHEYRLLGEKCWIFWEHFHLLLKFYRDKELIVHYSLWVILSKYLCSEWTNHLTDSPLYWSPVSGFV